MRCFPHTNHRPSSRKKSSHRWCITVQLLKRSKVPRDGWQCLCVCMSVCVFKSIVCMCLH